MRTKLGNLYGPYHMGRNSYRYNPLHYRIATLDGWYKFMIGWREVELFFKVVRVKPLVKALYRKGPTYGVYPRVISFMK